MHHKIKHIIWDWNGTLVDDAWLFVELMNEELLDRNLPQININKYREHFTFPVKQYYKNLGFDFQKENFEEVGYNFIQKYKRRNHEPKLFDETLQILTQIKELGISQSIISAQENQLLQASIQYYQLTAFFDSIMGIEHYNADSKIKIAQQNVEKMEYQYKEVLVVGDTKHDAEVAEKLGLNCVLFSNGHYSEQRLSKLNYKIIKNHLDLVQCL